MTTGEVPLIEQPGVLDRVDSLISRRKFAAVAAASGLLAVTACGGGGDSNEGGPFGTGGPSGVEATLNGSALAYDSDTTRSDSLNISGDAVAGTEKVAVPPEGTAVEVVCNADIGTSGFTFGIAMPEEYILSPDKIEYWTNEGDDPVAFVWGDALKEDPNKIWDKLDGKECNAYDDGGVLHLRSEHEEHADPEVDSQDPPAEPGVITSETAPLPPMPDETVPLPPSPAPDNYSERPLDVPPPPPPPAP